MIKINLLIVKRKKKNVQVYSTLIQGGIILGLTILVLGVFAFHLISKVSDMREEEAAKKKRLTELQVLIKEVDNYEKDNASYKEKTRIIEQLKKNQQAPLRLLDEVSEHLPKGVWLTSLADQQGVINISGYAFTNSDLVGYVQNLKSSKYIEEVALIESRQTTMENSSVYQFRLTFKIKV